LNRAQTRLSANPFHESSPNPNQKAHNSKKVPTKPKKR
jgi:hypothetical protein